MHPAEALAQQLKPGRGWDQWLADEFRQPYMRQLTEFLAAEEQAGLHHEREPGQMQALEPRADHRHCSRVISGMGTLATPVPVVSGVS